MSDFYDNPQEWLAGNDNTVDGEGQQESHHTVPVSPFATGTIEPNTTSIAVVKEDTASGNGNEAIGDDSDQDGVQETDIAHNPDNAQASVGNDDGTGRCASCLLDNDWPTDDNGNGIAKTSDGGLQPHHLFPMSPFGGFLDALFHPPFQDLAGFNASFDMLSSAFSTERHDDGTIEVRIPLPGAGRDDVTLEWPDNRTLSITVKQQSGDEHHRSYSERRFSRTFDLAMDAEHAKARMDNGVLVVDAKPLHPGNGHGVVTEID